MLYGVGMESGYRTAIAGSVKLHMSRAQGICGEVRTAGVLEVANFLAKLK